jgi:hypothetical protein
VHLTAYHGLLQNVVIRPGMKVLVHSAGGGVGSALVQLCKLHDLHVVGVVGATHKVDYVRQLGADAVIDKSTRSLWDEAERLCPGGYDLVFDANGPQTLAQSYAHLKPTGKLLVYGFHGLLPKQGGRISYLKAALGLLRMPRFNPLRMTAENKGVVAFNLSVSLRPLGPPPFSCERSHSLGGGWEDSSATGTLFCAGGRGSSPSSPGIRRDHGQAGFANRILLQRLVEGAHPFWSLLATTTAAVCRL